MQRFTPLEAAQDKPIKYSINFLTKIANYQSECHASFFRLFLLL